MTNVVLLEIKSKPTGPGIEGGKGAYVHVFFQEPIEDYSPIINEFIEYYGYEIITIEEDPQHYIDSLNWSDYNRAQARESKITGFPRFGTFQVFD